MINGYGEKLSVKLIAEIEKTTIAFYYKAKKLQWKKIALESGMLRLTGVSVWEKETKVTAN